MNLMLYFFWSGISLTVLYLFYKLLLQRETFFFVNRVYLLSSIFLSVLIPILDLSFLFALPKIDLVVSTLSVIPDGKGLLLGAEHINPVVVIYWIGVIINAIILSVKIYGTRSVLKLVKKGSAFSFWKTKAIDTDIENFEIIDAHENVHVKQYHTLDILLLEMVKVFFWFNPVIYYYRKSLVCIHEFLADEQAAKLAGSKKQYAMTLFLHNFSASPMLSNSFFNNNLLEERIGMLQRKKSNSSRLWKYVLTLPMVITLLLFCSFGRADFSRGNIKLDKAANFPGGFEAFSRYLVKATQKVSDKRGKVKVSFIVETDGMVSNVKIENGLDKASDLEALRIVGGSPKWEPAILNGEPVRSSYQMGINFTENK